MSATPLEDRAAIVDLAVSYAGAIDTRDWALLGSLFTPGATVDFGALGGVHQGPEAIVRLVSTTMAGLDATQHLLGNHVVTLAGDEATHGCYLQAQHLRSGTPGGDLFTVGGNYADRVVRTPTGWRLDHRALTVSWSGGNPAVVRPAAA